MTQLNWGNLAKDLNNPQTIAEATAAAITVHNDDPDAHIGPTRALESHRAAEIIDHRAESIVNDKIRPNARTYIAIVDNNSPADYDTIEDALDYACTKGSGTVYVRKGNYTPTRQLKFKYGVDLIGEGPGETVINRTAGVSDYLALDGGVPVSWNRVPTIYQYANDQLFEVDLPANVAAADLVGTYIEMPWGDGYVDSVNQSGQLYWWDNAPTTDQFYDMEFVPVLVRGSAANIVHVNGWQLITSMPDGDGLVMCNKYNSAIGVVDTYLGNGDYRMTADVPVNMKEHGLQFKAEGGRMSIISGVTIACYGSGAIFKNNDTNGRLYVRDSAFTGVTTIVDGNGKLMTIEDTDITFNGGSPTVQTGGAIFRNCRFMFSNCSGCSYLGGDGTVFENCNFYGGLLSGSNYLQYIPWNTMFNHCNFTNFAAGNVVNNFLTFMQDTARAPRFIGCNFMNSSGGNIYFRGRGLIIEACGFHSQQSNYIGMSSDSKRCIFTGNVCKGVQPTAPALCLQTNNVYHTENQATYNGTGTP